MVNSADELLQNLRANKPFDLIVLDDGFDARSPDGEELVHAPTVAEILQEIQAGYTASSDATILCFLRAAKKHDDPGTVSVFLDSTPQDREHAYTELGASFFLHKPYTIETLKTRLAQAAQTAVAPPVWLKALKQVRALYNDKQYAEVLGLLDKLTAAGLEDKYIAFALLRARCLAEMGADHLPASIEVLRKVLAKYPQSLSIRMLLMESYLRLNQLPEAFAEQLNIFATQKTSLNFERTLAAMVDVHRRTLNLTLNKNAAEDALMKFGKDTLEVLFRDPRPYSRRLRPQLFQILANNVNETKSLIELLKLLKDSDDVLEATGPMLRSNLKALALLVDGSDEPELKENFVQGHVLLLSVYPTEESSLEIATTTLLAQGKLAELDAIFKKAEAAGAKSLEFYTSLSRYHLQLENLKDASDVLHKAVRIRADDARVLELRQRWQQEFDARNKAAA